MQSRVRLFAIRAAGLVATVLMSSSCNSNDTLVACTHIGCTNGLLVHLAALPTGPFKVEYLVNGAVKAEANCDGTTRCAQDFEFKATVPDGVSIRVTTNAGTRVTEFGRLTFVRSRPNGPRCEPECLRANVTAQVPL